MKIGSPSPSRLFNTLLSIKCFFPYTWSCTPTKSSSNASSSSFCCFAATSCCCSDTFESPRSSVLSPNDAECFTDVEVETSKAPSPLIPTTSLERAFALFSFALTPLKSSTSLATFFNFPNAPASGKAMSIVAKIAYTIATKTNILIDATLMANDFIRAA